MIDLLRRRRSIRSYTKEPVSKESVELLVETLLRSPASRNLNPWTFIVVDDRELLGKLSEAKEHGSAFLRHAPLGIVVCGDPDRCDVWIEDCSIASILVQCTALSLGLGSCWIQIRERMHDEQTTAEAYVRELLGIPENLRVLSMVGIGHPNGSRESLAADQLEYQKVKHNSFSEDWR